MSRRTFVVLALLVSLALAGVLSSFASGSPDGLEHVAEQAGFADRAQESAAAGSPVAGYQVRGVEDPGLAGGLAGLVGALVVLVVTAGLTRAVRRPRATADEDHPAHPGRPEQG